MENTKDIKDMMTKVQNLLDSVYSEDLEYQGLESLPDLVADVLTLLDKEEDTKNTVYKIMQANMGKDFSLMGRPDPNSMLYALRGIDKYIKGE